MVTRRRMTYSIPLTHRDQSGGQEKGLHIHQEIMEEWSPQVTLHAAHQLCDVR